MWRHPLAGKKRGAMKRGAHEWEGREVLAWARRLALSQPLLLRESLAWARGLALPQPLLLPLLHPVQ